MAVPLFRAGEGIDQSFDGQSISYAVKINQFFVGKITSSRKIKVHKPTGTHDAYVHAWTEQEPVAYGTQYQDKTSGMSGVVSLTTSIVSGVVSGVGGSFSGAPTATLQCPGICIDPSFQIADNTYVFLRKRGLYTFTYEPYATVGSGAGSGTTVATYTTITEVFDILTGSGAGSLSPVSLVSGIRGADGSLQVAYTQVLGQVVT